MRHLLRHAEILIGGYDGRIPVHHFLKNYFGKTRALGSRDRKALSALLYAYYRASHAVPAPDLPLRIAASLLLCSAVVPALHGLIPEEWRTVAGMHSDPADLLRAAGVEVSVDKLLPLHIHFSAGISRENYLESLLHQPRLFLRIRRNIPAVHAALGTAGISHEWISESCLALPNGTDVARLLPDDCYVVQDASSQATAGFMPPSPGQSWWDVCCGAGGKSLLLQDKEPRISLAVSDIRESILKNLLARFRRYGLRSPKTLILDAADPAALAAALKEQSFDGLICDVPCTGSGTWARTPEGCYFFDAAAIPKYAERQHAILSNAAEYARPGGLIVYITCSVFRAENEAVVEQVISENKGLELRTMQLLNGTGICADSLFVAVLQKAAA